MLSALLLMIQAPAWREDFVGKAGFGHVTRILAMPDRLVFLDSPPPTVADGGDIYLWRDNAVRPTKVHSVSEQGIRTLRQFGSQLIVPGIDALEDWAWGNWYLSSDKGETWTKFRNLPKSVHVFDVAKWRGRLYMGVSDTGGAVVSSATGAEWRTEFSAAPEGSFGEVLSVVALPDALYAFWVEKWGAEATEANGKTDCYRFDGAKWEPRKLLPGLHQVWNTKVLGAGALILQHGRSFWLQDDKAVPVPALEGLNPAEVVEEGSGLLWLASDAKGVWGLYRSTFAKGEVGPLTRLIDLPPGLSGETLAIHGGRAYVGGAASPSGKVVSVALSALK